MPYPWEISRGKPQTIGSLVKEEQAFRQSQIRSGVHDLDLATTDPADLADTLGAQAAIPVPDVDFEHWTAAMDGNSDANRVTYAIPFRGDQELVRLALEWKSGGHLITVLPGEIEYSIWSRDKDASAIRAEADTVMTFIAQQWEEALDQLKAHNTGVRGSIFGALDERRRHIGEHAALLAELNRHESTGSGYAAFRLATKP